MAPELQKFIDNLHPSTTVISIGQAECLGHTADAVMVRNLYGQEIVWGMFSFARGKWKGKLANNANTEDVKYTPNG